jgi:hypothetical protein
MRPVGNETGRASVIPPRKPTEGFFVSDIDLDFRPKGYFWPLDARTHVISSIKGASRREFARQMFAEGREGELPPEVLQPSLPADVRQATGAIHPSLMGGEYLPDQKNDEIEIARITIESTTRDVTCVYARRSKGEIHFTVVDEYEGDTLTGKSTRKSKAPLTLGELTDFFLGAWDLIEVLEMNFEGDGHPPDSVRGFFEASSDFYPEFARLVVQRVENWLRKKRKGRNVRRER